MTRIEAGTLTGAAGVDLPEFADPPSDPLALLRRWLDFALDNGVREPAAMVLATSNAGCRPSTRTLLLKDVDGRGVTFGTSRTSRKGRDMAAVPWAAANLYWRELGLQINCLGSVELLSPAESDELFAERAPAAQAAAVASAQTAVLVDEARLQHAAAAVVDSNLASGDATIACPPSWSGYRLVIESVEFWQAREDRLHRRLLYERSGSEWTHCRLQP